MRRRLPALPLLLVLVSLIASCGGKPPAQGGPRTPRSVQAVLGDPRTVDPCTLTDPAALRRYGRGRYGAATNAGTVSLDYCLLHVRTSQGGLVQVAAGQLSTVDPAAIRGGDPILRRGPFRIVQEAPVPGHCERQIRITDRVAMRVSADLLTGQSETGLCGLAQASADSAVSAMEKHRVGHRRYPRNSLAWVDPCRELDTRTVRQVPGLERARPRSNPARHQCEWGQEQAQSPRIELIHTAGDPPRVLHGAAVQQPIAGRSTVVSVVGGDPRLPLCTAETGHIPFGRPASGQVEVAMLVVVLPGENGTQACDFARGLAQRAWPKLPPASG